MNLVEGYFPYHFQNQFPVAPAAYQQYPYQPYQQIQQQFYQPQPGYYQQPQNYYYEKNEVLYPDFNTHPAADDLQSPYTVYNLNRNAQVSSAPGYHVYEPVRKSYANVMGSVGASQNYKESSNPEEILRKNSHVWNLYQSGRFELIQSFDSTRGKNKIILKEKNGVPNPKYTVTKFKVPVSANNQGSDDDHILLVSFSNSHMEPNHHIQVDSVPYTYEDVINKSYAHVFPN